MPPKIHIHQSFLTTDDSIIETIALRYERRLEAELRRRGNTSTIEHLHELCNILWTVLGLKFKGQLTKNKDRKFMSAYTNKLKKI